MTTRLKKLRIDRVDFVDRGANPNAHITLAKRAEEDAVMADKEQDVAKRLEAAEAAVAAVTKRAEEAEAFAKAVEAKAQETSEALAKALDERDTKDAEAIAKGLATPSVEAKDKVAFVKALRGSEMGRKALTVIETLTKQVNAGALFVEQGSDNPTPVLKGYSRLEQLAEGYVKDGKATTYAKGMEMAMQTDEGKAAYEEHRHAAIHAHKEG